MKENVPNAIDEHVEGPEMANHGKEPQSKDNASWEKASVDPADHRKIMGNEENEAKDGDAYSEDDSPIDQVFDKALVHMSNYLTFSFNGWLWRFSLIRIYACPN